MTASIINFPGRVYRLPTRDSHERYLRDLFMGKTKDEVRTMWDGVGDDSFYHGPDGMYDCADIHGYLNLIGDGAYCAV